MEFTPKQRKIFRFFDGKRKRGIDPLEVDIAIERADFDWEANLTLARSADDRKVKIEAMADIMTAARGVFGLPEFDIDQTTGEESGVVASEVIDILFDFMDWRTKLENFTEPPATSQQSTAASQPTTDNGTDSTSTSRGSSPEPVSP